MPLVLPIHFNCHEKNNQETQQRIFSRFRPVVGNQSLLRRFKTGSSILHYTWRSLSCLAGNP